ncbi:MAG: hypothetical protein FVQ80_16155 [Planctomycetes bacterium]|nr:hypothetical protein [Planctomycetota bacterium]
MRRYLCTFLLLFIAGCGTHYPGYSNRSPYIAVSSHTKKTIGQTNLTYPYQNRPTLDAHDPIAKAESDEQTKLYLEGVANDLQEVEDNADNAAEKIKAMTDAFNADLPYLTVTHVGPVFASNAKSNSLDYPEFPDFNYFPPVQPHKPVYFDDEATLKSYNDDIRNYNKQVTDFNATVKAYIQDARHYIQNCENDYQQIRRKSLKLRTHIRTSKLHARR